MPTKNPRLTITLEPTLAAQLRRLSELTGNSQGALIAELLAGSQPTFARLIEVLEAAADAKASISGKVADDLAAASAKVERQLGLAITEFQDATAPLIEEVEAIRRRGRRGVPTRERGPSAAPVAAAVTPPSNRGVRSTSTNRKTRGK